MVMNAPQTSTPPNIGIPDGYLEQDFLERYIVVDLLRRFIRERTDSFGDKCYVSTIRGHHKVVAKRPLTVTEAKTITDQSDQLLKRKNNEDFVE